ncbi:Cellular nucleic acid-binding protein [Holothuria leucospilota]|uniref:Cellular nucleic acid-binding protein n=1 Tax=Holothuria leucospilota TaxID=206669 RepID=A0A9Q1HII4_HOLLE|nr:Cellular nucleic acid-binding protein [Holothuria leucospilota]
MLRDRLVCGVNNERIQRHLLSQAKLTFDKALDLALGLELAAKNADDLKQGHPTSREQVLRIPKGKTTSRNQQGNASKPKFKPCYRCGKDNHLPDDCYFKDKLCNNCGKKGHISKVCRSRKVKQVAKNEAPQQTDLVNSEKVYDLFHLSSINGAPLK